MSLIIMACNDTEENGRTKFTNRTLKTIIDTVDFTTSRIVVVDNGSCDETKELLSWLTYTTNLHVITLPENIGTARAINKGIALRQPGEHVVKIDNDVIIYNNMWPDQLEAAIARDPKIGIIGLKRKDLDERPDHENPFYRSTLKMLPHKGGEPWIMVEKVNHVMGTCQMYNSALLDKIGYLYQPRLYGFDDSLSAIRCEKAGFYNCFLPHINIDHIDPGGTPYTDWKQKVSGEDMAEFNRLRTGYQNGTISIYHDA